MIQQGGFRRWRAALLLCLIAAVACGRKESGSPEARIAFAEQADGSLTVTFNLAQSVRRLDLGPSVNGFRRAHWRVATADLSIMSEGGRDYLIGSGARFQTAKIAIDPYRNGFSKNYEPLTGLSSGFIIYTGHFQPWRHENARLSAAYDVFPLDGHRAAALGAAGAPLKNWRSPFRHPAFIYVGPVAPARLGPLNAVIDPAAPAWIKETLQAEAPPLMAALSQAFGRDLAASDMFVAMQEGRPGQLSYYGDALPGQFQMTLSGGGWKEPSEKARHLLLVATAHEAAHLWQMAARPGKAGASDWIHEGGAEAIAVETLTPPSERDAALDHARFACREALLGRSLAQAEAAGDWQASYACGHVLAAIAAQATGQRDVAGFWRELIEKAQKEGGYDDELFIEMIEEVSGRELADAVRLFPRTAFAAPDKELARLLVMARAAGRARK